MPTSFLLAFRKERRRGRSDTCQRVHTTRGAIPQVTAGERIRQDRAASAGRRPARGGGGGTRARRIVPAREAQVAALHALGYAQYQLADAEALVTLRSAIRIADRRALAFRAAYQSALAGFLRLGVG